MKKILLIISSISFLSLFFMISMHWNLFLFLLFVLASVMILRSKQPAMIPADDPSCSAREICHVKAAALLVEGIGFLHFCSSHILGILADRFHLFPFLRSDEFSAAIGLLCAAIGYPFAVMLVLAVKPYLSRVLALFKTRKKELLILTVIHILAILAILRENISYFDDYGRVMEGYQMSGYYGRYLANLLATWLHGNYYLTDVSPLPQLAAALVLAAADIILLDIFQKKESSCPKLFTVSAVIPLGLSPYFLTCLSYKYDAPYMALSVFFSILPLLFMYEDRLHYVLITMFSTIAMCLTYQASSGMLPMTVLAVSLILFVEKEKDIKEIAGFILQSAAGYIAGIFCFYFIISTPIPSDTYAGTGINIRKLPENLSAFSRFFISDMTLIWKIFIIMIAVCFVIELVRRSRSHKLRDLLITIASLCVMYMLSFGAYIVLDKTIYTPRYMYGLGLLLSIMMILISQNFEKNIAGCVMSLFLSGLFVSYAFTYGNALSVQKEYTDFRTAILADDLSEIAKSGNPADKKELRISGTIGLAPSVENTAEQYPVIRRSFRVMLADDIWGSYSLIPYYQLGSSYYLSESGEEEDWGGLELIKSNMYHDIRGDEEHVVVELK